MRANMWEKHCGVERKDMFILKMLNIFLGILRGDIMNNIRRL